MDKPTVPGSIANKVPKEIEDKVLELSVEHPAWGQQQVRDELIPHGIVVSATTERDVWLCHGIEMCYKRMIYVVEKWTF